MSPCALAKHEVQQLSSAAGKLQSPGRQSPARYFTSNSNIGRSGLIDFLVFQCKTCLLSEA